MAASVAAGAVGDVGEGSLFALLLDPQPANIVVNRIAADAAVNQFFFLMDLVTPFVCDELYYKFTGGITK